MLLCCQWAVISLRLPGSAGIALRASSRRRLCGLLRAQYTGHRNGHQPVVVLRSQQPRSLRRDDDSTPRGTGGSDHDDDLQGAPMSLLDGLLAWTEQLVQSAGAVGLAAVMAAEAVLPIPSEVVLPVVGTRVSSGGLTLVVAVLATTAGSVVGAAAVYALTRWGGRRWVTRLTRALGVSETRWAETESWFARHGTLVVLFGRLVPGLRCVVPLPAGSLAMPFPRFLSLTAIGSAAWNAAWIGAGAWLTVHWDIVVTTVFTVWSAIQPAALVAAVVGAAVLLVQQTRLSGLVATRLTWRP